MKILLVVHQFFPKYYFGTETYTLQLADGLKSLGHDVVVLAGDPVLPVPIEDEVVATEVRGLRVYAIGSAPSRIEAFRSSYCRPEVDPIFRKILELERPDLVHFTHLALLGSNLIASAKALGLPCMVSFTDFFGVCWAGNMMRVDGVACSGPGAGSRNCVADYLLHHGPVARTSVLSRIGHRVLRSSSSFWYGIFRRLVPFVLPRSGTEIASLEERPLVHESSYKVADHFVMATAFLEQVYVEKGFPRERMSQICYGVPQPSSEEMAVLDARYRGDFDTRRPVKFGFIGQIAKHKGVDLLVEGFLAAAPQNAELKIYGRMGSDPFSKSLEEQAAGDPRISFCGTFDSGRIYDVLTGIDVLCLPSRWHENAPLVLLNGLAAKTVMLVSNGHGLTQFVKPDLNGFIVDRSDVPAWRDAIARIASAPEQLAEIHSRHPGYAMTPEAYAELVANLYAKLNPEEVRMRRREADTLLLGLRDTEKWKFVSPTKAGACCMAPFATWEKKQMEALKEEGGTDVAGIPDSHLRDGVRKAVETPEQHVRFGIQLAEEFSLQLGSNLLHATDVLVIEGRSLNLARLFNGTLQNVTCAFSHGQAAGWARENVKNVKTVTWSDADGLPVPDSSMRLVIVGSLFQPYPEGEAASLLQEIARVLKPGGQCLFLSWGWSGFVKLPFNSKLYHSLGLSLFSLVYYVLPFLVTGRIFATKSILVSQVLKDGGMRGLGPDSNGGPRIQFYSRRALRNLARSSGLRLSAVKTALLRNYLDVVTLEKQNV